MDLSEFLLACIAEDEDYVAESDYEETDACRCGDPDCPARVLADIKWKRRIVELAKAASGHQHDHREQFGDANLIEPHEWVGFQILRALAQPYADRPGFREEWKV